MIIPISFLLKMENVSDKFGENIKTHVLCSINFSEGRAVCEMMWQYRPFATTVSNSKLVIFLRTS